MLSIRIIENFKMALDSIKANKLRSFLTMLGIIIGISSVITIISLGQGGKKNLMGDLEKIGATTVLVRSNPLTEQSSDKITMSDIEAIKKNGTHIKYVTPVSTEQSVIKVNNNNSRGILLGGNSELLFIRNSEILYGRYFTEKEVEDTKNVVVVDEVFAQRHFGFKDVVGETIYAGKISSPKKLTIVGVAKVEEYLKEFANEYMPSIVYMPITTLNSLYDISEKIDEIYLMTNSKPEVEDATYQVINILKARHNNRENNPYIVESMMKQISQVNNVINLFSSFIISVAAISLLVGGIGVMNIMLVSVTERTKEIGVRKALGATTNEILFQFLLEAITISLIGGIIGMILGGVGAFAIGSMFGVLPIISWQSVVLVIIFSSIVGVFFGIYPANKAAKLNPIDALRYE